VFDGHALLLVIVALALLATAASVVSCSREREDEQWARNTIPTPEAADVTPITVVCGECGATLCEVLTPREAAIEDQLHHLIAHGGGA